MNTISINKQLQDELKETLDQAARLLDEYGNDHGYCTYCHSRDCALCDPNICMIAHCIDKCKSLSQKLNLI